MFMCLMSCLESERTCFLAIKIWAKPMSPLMLCTNGSTIE